MASIGIVPIYDIKRIINERKALQLLLESKPNDDAIYVRILNHKIVEFSFQSDIVHQYICMLINLCRVAPINDAIDITTTISYLLDCLFTHYTHAFQLLHIDLNYGDSPIVEVLRFIIANKGNVDEISTRRELIELIKAQLSAYQYRSLAYINGTKLLAPNVKQYLNNVLTLASKFDELFIKITIYAKPLVYFKPC